MEQLYSALQASFIPLLVILAGFLLRTRLREIKHLPPGPTPWPVVGNLAILGVLPHQTLAMLAKQFGPLMSLRLGSMNYIVVSSPNFAKEFLKTNDHVWASRPASAVAELLCYDTNGIGLSPYGPRWKIARKIIVQELLTSKRIAQFQKSRRRELLAAVNGVLDDCDVGKTVQMDSVASNLTLNMIVTMIMNDGTLAEETNANRDKRTFIETVRDAFELAGLFNIGDFIPWLDRFDVQGYRKKMKITGKKLDEFCQVIIDGHREKQRNQVDNKDNEDNVQDLVDAMLNRPRDADGENLTELQMKGIIQDFLLAGADTSACTIEWGLSELIKNPRVMRKAQEEIDSVVGRDRIVEESDLPNLPYLLAVVKEVFRLHPVAPLMIPHESIQACTIGGYQIPAKTRLFVNVYAIHTDPAVWERPLEFYPERFLDQKIDLMGLDFEFLPFGSGRRMCPGKNLGLLSVQSTLAVLIHTCDWCLPEGQNPEELEMSERFGLVIPRKNPLVAIAAPRLSRQVIRDLKN